MVHMLWTQCCGESSLFDRAPIAMLGRSTFRAIAPLGSLSICDLGTTPMSQGAGTYSSTTIDGERRMLLVASRCVRGVGRGLGLMVVGIIGAACNSSALVESPLRTAMVFGTVLVDGSPAVGRTLASRVTRPDCQRLAPMYGNGVVGADGRYKIFVAGETSEGRVCVRVGLPPVSGSDTTWATGLVGVRTSEPFDIVRVDLARGTP